MKIGVGIITCDRPEFLNTLRHSLEPHIDLSNVIAVNDGEQPVECFASNSVKTNNPPRQGVSKSKNRAFYTLLERGCDYIFILEDDIRLLPSEKNVFTEYIKCSQAFGIQHLNFAFHGKGNLKRDGSPAVINTIEHNGARLSTYPNLYGAFSMYTRKCLNKVGLFDESYKNALDHVEHTYRITQNNMYTPFRAFADIADSNLFLIEQDTDHRQSKIRRSEDWMNNFQESVRRFEAETGINVLKPFTVPPKEEILQSLRNIHRANH